MAGFYSGYRADFKYHDEFEKSKRMVLLAVCQHGTGHIQTITAGKTKEELKKAVSRGIELWVVETKTGEDGISLLKYRNFTDKMLKS